MKNNTHPLTQDWGMYFNGTYIFSNASGESRCMSVENVEKKRGGDDTDLDGMEFVGTVFNIHGEVEYGRWSAEDRDDFRPVSGYFDITGDGLRDVHVTFNVNNRSQRKGVDPRNVLLNGMALGVQARQLCRIYQQSLEMISRPGHRDFYVAPNGVVNWKGIHVGHLADNQFTAVEAHKNKEAMLWQLLQTI